MRLRRHIVEHIFWRGAYFLSLFILNVFISRYFKADGSGWIYYLVNNLSLLLLLAGLSLESGAAYYASTREINAQKLASLCVLWSLLGSACSFLVIWVATPAHFPQFSSFNEYLMGCTSYVLGVLLTTYFSALFFARQDFFLPNALLLLMNLATIGLLIVFHASSAIHRHFIVFYFTLFLLQGLVLVFAYWLKSGSRLFAALPSMAEFRKLSSYSAMALAANLVFFLVYRMDYWFVSKFCNGHDLGNYIQVSKLGQLFLLLPGIIASTIFPRTAAEKENPGSRSVKILARNLFLLTLLLLSIFAIIGKWLFPLVFGESFDSMYHPFLLMIPGILCLVMVAPFSAYFAGMNKVIINVKGAMIALLLILVLDILFIPRYGIYAAAAVSSIGYFSILTFTVLKYRKATPGSQHISGFFLPDWSDYSLIKEFWQARRQEGDEK